MSIDLQGMTTLEVCKAYPEQAVKTMQDLAKRNEVLEAALKEIVDEANFTTDAGDYILWVLNKYSKLV
jgi:hypothetical protein